jgi:hypothetical protein
MLKNQFGLLITILLGWILLTGCADQSVEKFKERGVAEQEGSNKAENENLAKKAEMMERDLAKRHLYYSTLEGEYQGLIKAGSEVYKIKLIFARSIPPYQGERVRNLSEIEADLNNLFFYTKVVQWHPSDENTAVGCQIESVRPNMDKGMISLSANTCTNFYQMFFSETPQYDEFKIGEQAKTTSNKIKNELLMVVPYLHGTIQPSNISMKYTFVAEKVQRGPQ